MEAQSQSANQMNLGDTIASALSFHAHMRPASPAFVGQGGATITYAQLSHFVSEVQAQLSRLRIRPDACVGLLVPPGLFGAALIVGLASSVTLVPLNPGLSQSELAEEIRRTGMSALLAARENVAGLAWLGDAGPTLIAASPGAHFTPVLEMVGTSPTLATISNNAVTTGDSVALLLRSSGTTGSAKLIGVSHRNLIAMSEKMADWFSLSELDRVACTLPLFYAAGLKTTLFVPLLIGASIAFPRPEIVFQPAEWLESIRPTFLSVAPTPLRAMLDRLRGLQRPLDLSFLRFAICGAAYLPDPVREEAERLLGVPVLEYYGLSEAGAMAANPAPPRRRKPGTVGLFRETELVLLDPDGVSVEPGKLGAIAISGPSVTPSQIGMDRIPEGPRAGWLLTGDLGSVDEDGYLRIVGRTKEIINRGGEKVSPYEVEKALLEHPDVADAGVFVVPHPRLGESVAAAVVLKSPQATTALALKTFVAERLARFKVPQTIYLVDQLPRGATGKLLRNALSDTVARATNRPVAEPDRMLEHQIIEIWQRLLERRDFGIDDDFFEVGGDSLLAAQMLVEVETLFKKQLPQSMLGPTLTIRAMTDALCSDLGASRELISKVQSGTGAPLFFCHGDYVSRGLYANRLVAQLGQDRPVYLLHFYQSMHRPDLTVEEIAQLYAPEVLAACPEGPVIIGGYCNGALIAWELASLLQRQNRELKRVLLVEAPSLNARPVFRALHKLCMLSAAVLPGRYGTLLEQKGMRAIWHYVRNSRRLSSRSRQPAHSKGTKKRHETAAGVDTPSPHWQYLRTLARYIPKRLDADVTCFIAGQGNRLDTDPAQWKRLARSVEVVELPGTHYTVITSEATLLGLAMRTTLSQL